ncbi:small multi-drug export protein [Patescibacteria group bacterium]|nr:small multi-drug export protein [Patescibacteria group bacterium]
MIENYLDFFKNIPPEFATMLIAMTPIAESRVAIPIALGVFKLSIVSAVFWSIIGTIIPALFIVLYLKPLAEFLSKHFKIARIFFDWWFKSVVGRFQNKYDKYKRVALILFVAIPLPFTGAWSGSVASFLFGIKPRKAYPLIVIGVLISAFIVTLAYYGIFGAFKLVK